MYSKLLLTRKRCKLKANAWQLGHFLRSPRECFCHQGFAVSHFLSAGARLPCALEVSHMHLESVLVLQSFEPVLLWRPCAVIFLGPPNNHFGASDREGDIPARHGDIHLDKAER